MGNVTRWTASVRCSSGVLTGPRRRGTGTRAGSQRERGLGSIRAHGIFGHAVCACGEAVGAGPGLEPVLPERRKRMAREASRGSHERRHRRPRGAKTRCNHVEGQRHDAFTGNTGLRPAPTLLAGATSRPGPPGAGRPLWGRGRPLGPGLLASYRGVRGSTAVQVRARAPGLVQLQRAACVDLSPEAGLAARLAARPDVSLRRPLPCRARRACQ